MKKEAREKDGEDLDVAVVVAEDAVAVEAVVLAVLAAVGAVREAMKTSGFP